VFECGPQWRRDRTQLKAGVISDDHLWPVHHMQGNAISRLDATGRQSTCETFGFSGKPLIAPGLAMENKSRACRSRPRLVRQGAHWVRIHFAGSPFAAVGRKAGPSELRRDVRSGENGYDCSRTAKDVTKAEVAKTGDLCRGPI
jgi:hypothetical protein